MSEPILNEQVYCGNTREDSSCTNLNYVNHKLALLEEEKAQIPAVIKELKALKKTLELKEAAEVKKRIKECNLNNIARAERDICTLLTTKANSSNLKLDLSEKTIKSRNKWIDYRIDRLNEFIREARDATEVIQFPED